MQSESPELVEKLLRITDFLLFIDSLAHDVESTSMGFDRDWVESVVAFTDEHTMADVNDALSFVQDWVNGLPADIARPPELATSNPIDSSAAQVQN